ncbi:MAG: hypothetical protein ACRDH2_09290 [Anaerolineales bacterium]
MILVRDVFQAKYGKGGELVALLKETRQWPSGGYSRILTDASGPFFTVVAEAEVASWAEWEKGIAELFSNPDFGGWFARMTPLVESGRREFYNVE